MALRLTLALVTLAATSVVAVRTADRAPRARVRAATPAAPVTRAAPERIARAEPRARATPVDAGAGRDTRRAPRAGGVLVADDSGVPIAGLTVRLAGLRHGWECTTDAAGRFELPEDDRILTLGAFPDEEAPFFQRCWVAPQDVLVLPRAAWITGTVVDEAGTPVTWRHVAAEDGGGRRYERKTGADGRFRIKVPVGTAVELDTTRLEGAPVEARAGEEVELRVAWGSGRPPPWPGDFPERWDRHLRVAVRFDDGEPVADAVVTVTEADTHDLGGWRGRTDRTGRVCFVDLPRGFRLDVAARAPRACRGEVEVDANATRSFVVLPRAAPITGSVSRAGGAAVRGVRVFARSDEFETTALTDGRGGFELLVPVAGPGRWSVGVSSGSLAGEPRVVATGATDVRLVLE